MLGTLWTEAEIARLRGEFPTLSTQALADALGRSRAAVTRMAQRLGIKKTSDRLSEMARENLRKRRDRA